MKKIFSLILFFLCTIFLYSQTFQNTTSIPITDLACIYSPIEVTGIGQLTGNYIFSTIKFTITHSYDADLDIYLVAPDGTTLEVSTDNGSELNDYINTVIDPWTYYSITSTIAPFTGNYRPEGDFSILNANATNADGIWQLKVCDDNYGGVGIL